MRDALHIFRKDVRHLWPGIVLVLAVTALEGAVSAFFAAVTAPLQAMAGLLWLLSCAYLGASVVLQERLAGDQQFWLTRPYSRPGLLFSKLLFLVVFLALPQFVAQTVALAVNDVPPLAHIPGLACTALLFSMAIGLVAAALASVTEDLLQFLYVLLAVAGVEIVALVLARAPQWGGLEWVRDSAVALVVLTGAAAVLLLQYARRQTTQARCILGGAALLVAGARFLGLWGIAITVQSAVNRQIDPNPIRISFQPAAAGVKRFQFNSYSPRPHEEAIAIPIVVSGLPHGTQILTDSIAASIDASGGPSWRVSWNADAGLAAADPLQDDRTIRSDGFAWQYLNIEKSFYRTVQDAPITLHATLALTLLGNRQPAPLPPGGLTRSLPHNGLCVVDSLQFTPSSRTRVAACAWPLDDPARAYIQVRAPRTGEVAESLLRPGGSYSPYPTSGSVWRRATTAFSSPADAELTLETWQAVAHFERTLDIPAIRLADYVVRRPN